MKQYTKPMIAVERFALTQQIASCGAMKINSMDMNCVLSAADAPSEMKDLALVGFFMEGACPRTATDGAICFNTSTNMAFTS